MNGLRNVICRCALGGAVAWYAMAGGGNPLGAAPNGAGHELAGTYEAEQVSLSDMQAQMTLRVYLTNSQEAAIDVSSAELESVLTGATQDLESSLTVKGKSTVNFSHAVTISRDEFEKWRAGAHPLLVVKFSSEGAEDSVRTIALLPETTARAN
jgi:hypothetical protein